MGFFSQLKSKFKKEGTEEEFIDSPQGEYVELKTDEGNEVATKVLVRPFTLDDFEDIKMVIDTLRDGRTVALINIKPLKEKDINELKRAVAKLRKTCDALEGEIAGFTEDIVIATSSSAKIHKTKQVEPIKAEEKF